MGNLVRKIAALMGTEVEVSTSTERVRPAESEVERLVCDSRRMRELTSWSPQYDLETSLQETIEWIRAHPADFKVGLYTV